MIALILKLIFLDVLWTMGWKIITEKNMLLEKVGDFGEKKLEQGYKVFDGLIICPWCIPNIHGVLFVVPLSFGLGIMPFVWDWKYLMMWPFVVAGASLISGLIWSLYKHLELKHKYYEHLEQQEYFNLKNKKKEYNNKK